jgi:hypothetical protein
MKAPAVFLLMIAGFVHGDVLRISEVRSEAVEGTERMTLRFQHDGQVTEEVLFVLKEVVVSDADVAQAWVYRGQAIGVKLKPEGARKMVQATRNMNPRQDRLAVIVDGKLVSAPRVLEPPLRASFQIDMDDLDERALEELARRIAGRASVDPEEEPTKMPPVPHVETVPFTEEEYQQKKDAREKMGLYFLDRLPSEEELDAKLKDGTSVADVVEAFGKPSHSSGKPDQGEFSLLYQIAPEKRPEKRGQEIPADGFHVQFSDGAKIRWSFTYGNLPREEKAVGRKPGLLVASYPEIDFSSGDVDLVALLEGVTIPDIRQEVNATDLYGVLALARMTSDGEGADDKEEPMVRVDCDVMKFLALHFPEAKALSEKAADGKISARALGKALSPYMLENKPLPELKAGAPGGQ